jgi:DNA-binding beta-propeller fold protein YncE
MYIYADGDTSISKFGPDGKLITRWGVHESDGKPATEISSMVVKDGKLLALDATTSELLNFNLDGTGGDRTSICSCFFARGMSLANDGNFWITDTGGNKIVKAGINGNVIAIIDNGKGSNPGQFVEPAGVSEASDGTIYVSDVTNHRVQSLASDFKPIAAWPTGQSTPRDGNRVVADGKNVLVTEYDSKAVVEYDAQGKELARWQYASSAAPLIPAGITAAGDGKFLVLFPYDNQAVLFSPGQ